MAYTQTRSFGNKTQSAAAPASSKAAGDRPAPLLSTGLFSPTKEGVKAIGSVQVKEDVTIPAGSYINLYESEKKSDKSPAFKLQITVGKLKSAN